MSFADSVEQTAKRLQIGTDELQLWTAAAREADVPQEALTAGLVEIKKKNGRICSGLMRAREARPFQLLGLSREEMAQAKDASAQLLLIADAMSKKSPAERKGIAERLNLVLVAVAGPRRNRN